MGDKYGSHHDFMKSVTFDATKREEKIENVLRKAFQKVIKTEPVEVIYFSDLSALDIALAIEKFPVILKSLLATCNIGARAIERDLQIKNLDTYKDGISPENAKIIAGFIRPFLPSLIPLPALVHIDKIYFIDKEIRKLKGRWEKEIVTSLNKHSDKKFIKRKFRVGGQVFEIDAAFPGKGTIELGIDIKRIEARRDIHKRIDEIVNKSRKFKKVYPKSKFAAVIYYPFIEEHINVKERLTSSTIDTIVFASQSRDSIFNATKILLSKLGVK